MNTIRKVNSLLFVEAEETKRESNYGHHPLGLMYLSAVAKQARPGMQTRIFHTSVYPDPENALAAAAQETSPDIIGVRACAAYAEQFKSLCRMLRRLRPETLLIAGGPYPTTMYEAILEERLADIVVLGEGEKVFLEILGRIESGRSVPLDVENTAVWNDGRIHRNPSASSRLSLDSLPFPDYNAIDRGDYADFGNQSSLPLSSYTLVQTSRGCPYGCSYCHSMFGKTARSHSVEYVLEYMRHHYALGERNFMFIDDAFNIPRGRAKSVLEAISKALPGVRLFFTNGLRADQVDDELIGLLEASGTVMVGAAIETAVARLQSRMGKNLDLELAAKAIHTLSKRFVTRVFFMIGFPSETFNEAKATIDFSRQFVSTMPALFIVKVYPGTKLYRFLRPDTAQKRALERLSRSLYDVGMTAEKAFYGDFFPKEIVPLDSESLFRLKMYWAKTVLFAKERIAAFHSVLNLHLTRMANVEPGNGGPGLLRERFYRQMHHYIATDLPYETFRARLTGSAE